MEIKCEGCLKEFDPDCEGRCLCYACADASFDRYQELKRELAVAKETIRTMKQKSIKQKEAGAAFVRDIEEWLLKGEWI